MAFEETPKREDAHVEEAKKRARWAYIQPFMDAIRAERNQEVDAQA